MPPPGDIGQTDLALGRRIAQTAPAIRIAVAGVEEEHGGVNARCGVGVRSVGGQFFVVIIFGCVGQPHMHMSFAPAVRGVVGSGGSNGHVRAEEEFVGRINVPIRIAVGRNGAVLGGIAV